jgi:radical SAM protein with 4Fe4S-binding SPASM domain
MRSKNSQKQYATLKETDFPIQVMTELVCGCNLRCIMCPIGTGKISRKKGEMEFSLFQKIIDEIACENPMTKLWPAVMGEPLLAGNMLFEYLRYAQTKKVPVFLNTNAVLLDNRMILGIIEAGVRQVIVGLDANSEDTYQKIRRGGDFRKVVRNVQNLIKAAERSGLEVVIQYIEMKENAHEVESFKKFWLKEGAIVKIRLKQGWGDLVGSEMLENKQEKRKTPCPWLVRNLEVLWNGDVCQCDGDMDGRYICGNINDNSIKDIWQGEMKRRRERQYNGDFNFEPCNKCNDWQIPLSEFYYPDEPDRVYAVDERNVDSGLKHRKL